jgi:hypothetical protein
VLTRVQRLKFLSVDNMSYSACLFILYPKWYLKFLLLSSNFQFFRQIQDRNFLMQIYKVGTEYLVTKLFQGSSLKPVTKAGSNNFSNSFCIRVKNEKKVAGAARNRGLSHLKRLWKLLEIKAFYVPKYTR